MKTVTLALGAIFIITFFFVQGPFAQSFGTRGGIGPGVRPDVGGGPSRLPDAGPGTRPGIGSFRDRDFGPGARTRDFGTDRMGPGFRSDDFFERDRGFRDREFDPSARTRDFGTDRGGSGFRSNDFFGGPRQDRSFRGREFGPRFPQRDFGSQPRGFRGD